MTKFFGYAVSFKKSMLVRGRFGEGGWGSEKVSNGRNERVKKSIYESFLSIIKKNNCP